VGDPRIESVEFGGTGRIEMYKKDDKPWKPESETFGFDQSSNLYDTEIGGRVWRRYPPGSNDIEEDPVCYTFETQTSEPQHFTAKVTLWSSCTLSNCSLEGKIGGDNGVTVFYSSPFNVASNTYAESPAMNYLGAPESTIGREDWTISWRLFVDGPTIKKLGSTKHTVFRVFPTAVSDPEGGGSDELRRTAKRVDWLVRTATGTSTRVGAAIRIAAELSNLDKQPSGTQEYDTAWDCLDRGYGECAIANTLLRSAVIGLGVPSGDVEVTTAFPSTNSDVTDMQHKYGNSGPLLRFRMTPNSFSNSSQNLIKLREVFTWYYIATWASAPYLGPFTGAGAPPGDEEKKALWEILDQERDTSAGYFQFWEDPEDIAPNLPLEYTP
jgi:hypothetical protein